MRGDIDWDFGLPGHNEGKSEGRGLRVRESRVRKGATSF
jgi:hypothetical protein